MKALRKFWTKVGEGLGPFKVSALDALGIGQPPSEPWVRVKASTSESEARYRAVVYGPNGQEVAVALDDDHRQAVLRAWEIASHCGVYSSDQIKKLKESDGDQ